MKIAFTKITIVVAMIVIACLISLCAHFLSLPFPWVYTAIFAAVCGWNIEPLFEKFAKNGN